MAREKTIGTRDRIVDLLRRREATVEELARALGISDNAVRSHLPAMERDGLIEAVGTRPGTRKPSVLYRTTPAADEGLSRAYVPVLRAVLASLAERMEADDLIRVMEEAGRRLAAGAGRGGPERALRVLEELGAAVSLSGDPPVLEGAACPVGAVVRERPEVCRAVQALIAGVTGRRVRERCDRGERPACRFELGPPSRRSAAS